MNQNFNNLIMEEDYFESQKKKLESNELLLEKSGNISLLFSDEL